MENLLKSVIGLFIVVSAETGFSIPMDPLWMFADSENVIFSFLRMCDTNRTNDVLCRELESDDFPDTGDSYDKSHYFNFNYQFSSSKPVIVRDEFDTTIIIYKDSPRPGFAGFKSDWDYGMTGFPLARYKYLIFAHKGPNANHKVTVRAWYNSGECGAPSFNEGIGTFAASDTWKLDTIVIPEALQNKPDRERNFNKYYELVFIINNLDPNDTTSGLPGCLNIDNIKLAGCNPIDTSPKSQLVNEGAPATFKVRTSRANRMDDVFSFQWKKNGTDITGANDSVFTISSVKSADAGAYKVAVTVSSTGLTFTSYAATLTIGDVALLSQNVQNRFGKNAFLIRSLSNGNVQITSPMSMKNPLTISLYEIDGRVLINRVSRTFDSGNSIFIQGNEAGGRGVYLVEITGPDLSLTKQIIIAK